MDSLCFILALEDVSPQLPAPDAMPVGRGTLFQHSTVVVAACSGHGFRYADVTPYEEEEGLAHSLER